MGGRRRGLGFRLFGTLAVLAGSLVSGGALLAVSSAVVGSGQAAADTPNFNMTCTGVPVLGTVQFPTTITGSIPADVANESTFSVSGNEWLVTVPSALTSQIDSFYGDGSTVTATVTATINVTGTMEGSESQTINFGSTPVPSSGTFVMTGIPTSTPSFTGNGSNVSVTPGVNISAFDITVDSNPTPPLACTTPTPSPVIATAAGVHDVIGFVTGPGPNTITPLDLATDTTDTAFNFGTSEPGEEAITPDGATDYVTGLSSDVVTPIDIATNTVGSPITVGNGPEGIAITPDGSTAYVAVSGTDQVVPINLATDTVGTSIQLEVSPVAVAITPNGATAYAVSSNDDSVTPIDLATGAAGPAINVGNSPNAIAITPDGSTAYVVDTTDNNVIPIDTATNTAGPAITVGTTPGSIAITPDGSTAYVANEEDGTVTPIDTSANTAGTAIPVGLNPNAIAITPDGSTAEAVNLDSDTVTPIDTGTNNPGTPMSAGNDPWDIAITPDQSPVAALSVAPANAGQPTSFNASASTAPSSPIVNYAWNFGDGNTANTSVPTTTHTYAHQGTYTASVTETDAAGTSLTKVFTGQTMSREGGPQARTSSTFDVGVVTSDTCVVPGFRTTNFPAVVFETTPPPSSIDAGGTFQTALGAEVSIPGSVINHFRNLGATSLTVSAQATSEAGKTTGGAPSGAVSPNTESTSATNLPQSDPDLAPNVPYSYITNYNPLSWQTGPGTGVVKFVPGDIDISATFVIHGTPTTEAISCTSPPGAASLGSTTVNPSPPTPTFQVPTSTPSLQNQVSAGTDGGWGITIANVSTATVSGLSATVNVSDAGAALSYDLTGMAATGTNCSSAGSGRVTCSIGNLSAGASDTLNVLVRTSGLLHGVVITGSAVVTSSNQTGHTTLGSIGVIVLQSGNGTKSVAAPGIPLVSTKASLTRARASITLTLPTTKIRRSAATRARALALAVTLAGTTSVSPPPVAVTLESLAPRTEPALCPPSGSSRCEGNIIQAVGNFSAYTNKKAPIIAVLKFAYGLKVPKGSIYMLKSNGTKVLKLAACTKTTTGYSTPCVEGPEVIGGTAAHDNLYAQDTVYFTGVDPVMGRRG